MIRLTGILNVNHTHPDGSRVGAFDSWSVKAGEKGTIAHRVTLSEDQRLRLTTRKLCVQPPDLREIRKTSPQKKKIRHFKTDFQNFSL